MYFVSINSLISFLSVIDFMGQVDHKYSILRNEQQEEESWNRLCERIKKEYGDDLISK